MPRSTLKEHLGCQVYCNHTATNHGLNLQKTPFFSPNSLTSLLQSLADLCWDRSPWKTLVQSNPSVQYPHPRSCGVVSSIRNDTDENLLVFWRWGEQAPKFWNPKLPPSSLRGENRAKPGNFIPTNNPSGKILGKKWMKTSLLAVERYVACSTPCGTAHGRWPCHSVNFSSQFTVNPLVEFSVGVHNPIPNYPKLFHCWTSIKLYVNLKYVLLANQITGSDQMYDQRRSYYSSS